MYTFSKLTKSWRKGKCPPQLSFKAYPDNRSLCIVRTLEEYMHRTAAWRQINGCSQLLLSHIRPHKEVSVSTVSIWVKTTLSLAGIDISQFKAHSTWSASSSKAFSSGLSLDDVLKRGNWYQRPFSLFTTGLFQTLLELIKHLY